MQTYREFDRDGKHYEFVYDEHYQPDKCCGASEPGEHKGDSAGPYCAESRDGGGEEACERSWNEEYAKLQSGEWVALGCIVTKPCPGPHCEACGGTVEVASLWGIVLESTDAAIEAFDLSEIA